jgi:adenylate cyclase
MTSTRPEDENYRRLLVTGIPELCRLRRFWAMLPHDPRCRLCNAPFAGAGRIVARAMGIQRWSQNPTMCNRCFPKEQGGAEVEATFVFADVRGSTSLAEQMGPSDFTALIERFFAAVVGALVRHEGFIEGFGGDEVKGVFVPGLAGSRYAERAIEAAQSILRVTGHATAAGPWIPVGVGVHAGTAYIGTVDTGGTITDIGAFGDTVNTVARLTSAAGAGEVIVSESALAAAVVDPVQAERRELALKGKAETVAVRVLHAY